MPGSGPIKRESLRPIVADEAYPLHLFKEFTGMSDSALRQARRKGLKVRKQGRQHFILGADWLEHIEAAPCVPSRTIDVGSRDEGGAE